MGQYGKNPGFAGSRSVFLDLHVEPEHPGTFSQQIGVRDHDDALRPLGGGKSQAKFRANTGRFAGGDYQQVRS